jgi:site-specific DNA recombinase
VTTPHAKRERPTDEGEGAPWVPLARDSAATIESLPVREGRSERSIRMNLSLAFVAPPILAAAIDGRLPRGFGVKRLMDLPMAWSAQWTALGLTAPATI